MEAWYTDKKKGICHGEVADTRVDYCNRRSFLINGKWIDEDRLFRSERELKERIESYIQHARWEDLAGLGNVSSGYCIFRSTEKREWL